MNANLLFKIISVWNLCSELVAKNNLQYEDRLSGVITSPGYPGNYHNDANYTWIIRTASHSAKVTFRILEMNIEEWQCDDYLEIAEIEPYFRLFKRCGHWKNESVIGRGKKIRVSFISDESLTDKGFKLTWRVSLPPTESLPETTTTQTLLASTTKYKERTSTKKKDVKTTSFEQNARTSFPSQELITTDTLNYEDNIAGHITSPGYPLEYPNNSNYTWIIRTGNSSANIAIRIFEMDIKETSPCGDYLEIEETEPCCVRLFKQCGHVENKDVFGRGKKIRISFLSDQSLTGSGFNLVWRVSPSKVLPETKFTTQKMFGTFKNNRITTESTTTEVQTTASKQNTATLPLCQGKGLHDIQLSVLISFRIKAITQKLLR